ncbi:PSD1 and planctomycete cytochrome C domain-containing protein [Maioricimonas sp. JC845]|uniref:PSD1 and planctomycete cytochrome C domain-containing protein n=1 Tax=Maioricimonas sp. JC845 TaxID=3232138 RepID=UPI003459B26D
MFSSMSILRFVSLCVALLSVVGTARAQVSFNSDVRPLLSDRCFHCHGPDEETRATELRLDQRESITGDLGGYRAVVPGDPAASELIKRITSDDPDLQMPPPDSKRSLSDAEIETLRQWVRQGADWEEHWSFVPPERPVPPEVSRPGWTDNPIDAFVLARMEQAGLSPSPEASKETLIRRLSLDLTGLPPTPDEVDAFVADESPDAYERLVDRLFASVRYGEHMATPWLDAARYADSNGYQGERTRTMWPWRDWVVRALNDNMPFDQFTIEQIAGDLLPDPTRDQLVATGFHRNHMLNGEGGRIAEESRVDYVIDRVNTTATTWLGLTLACCQCHDHKYDPFSQAEYYQLYAYFNSIDETGRVDAGGNARPVLELPTPEQEQREQQLRQELADRQAELRKALEPSRRQQWEEQLRGQLANERQTPYWQRALPVEYLSKNGQTMELLPDGSVFVTGANPEKDTYTLVLPVELEQITGLRLEALTHESFTNGGLARSNSGNFVLTEIDIRVRQATEPQEQAKPVAIASAEADFEQGGFPVEKAFDGNGGSGWAVHNPGDMKHNRSAVFAFAEPVAAGPGTILEVRLEHQSQHRFHNLGRFRLSVTSRSQPSLKGDDGLSEDVRVALRTPADQRTDDQKKRLDEQFRKTDPGVVAAQGAVDKARKALDSHRGSYLKTMVMKDRKEPRETFPLIRGVWDNPDKSRPLQPGVPGQLPPLPEDAPSNRLALARWLVRRENPLTARVTVNRYWQHFFGTGLVKTAEDFGTQGDPPSHPELLDWLAVEFMESGWDVKRLQKRIVMSATYRQSSEVTEDRLQKDPLNRLLSRAPRYRLTAQAIRDQALYLSGLLVERVGGEPVKPYQPGGVWLDLTLGKIRYEQDQGEKLYRRSLYTFWRRSVAPTMLFDVPARQTCVVKQARTNTPLHALTLMNDITYVEASRKMAERVIREGGETDADRLAYAFRLATSRRPSDDEEAALVRLYETMQERYRGNAAAAEELLAVGESPRAEEIDTVELAAMTAVMNVVLNLDEVITRE